MKKINLGMMPFSQVRLFLVSMEADSEMTFQLYRHGYTTTFRVIRTEDGWREANSVYGIVEGEYGLPFDLDGMVEEINSILDK